MRPPLHPDVLVVTDAAIRENTVNPASVGRRLPVALAYSKEDPWAVWFVLGGGRYERKAWAVSRDVVAAGVAYPSGDGDVRIRREGFRVLVRFESPEGRIELAFHRSRLRRFVRSTFRVVGQGREDVGSAVDAAVAEMLAGGWVL